MESLAEELKMIYRVAATAQDNIAYNKMVREYAEALGVGDLPVPQKSPISPSVALDSEIPRPEIEGSIEVITTKFVKESLRNFGIFESQLDNKLAYHGMIMVNCKTPIYSVFDSVLNAYVHPVHNQRRSLVMESDETESSIHQMPLAIVMGNDCEIIKTEPIEREEEEKKDPGYAHKDYTPVAYRVQRLVTLRHDKPKIDLDISTVPFHPNMARCYNHAVRTPIQQQRRTQNTIAARLSRNKTRVLHQIMKRQQSKLMKINIDLKRQAAGLRVYINKILDASDCETKDLSQVWEKNLSLLFEKTLERINRDEMGELMKVMTA